MRSMAMRLDGAGKRYNYEWIFRRLTHDFIEGKTYTLLGPNGSGKSTLLQCLSGARTLNEGSLEFIHNETTVAPEFHYRHVSLAAPYQELIEEFTLAELLRFHRRVKPLVNDVSVNDFAERCMLTASLHKPLKLYSSGMKQRVKVLLALLSDVPLVLLDEPATNLDETGMQWYQQLVHTHKANRIVIIASNDPREHEFCDERLDITDYKR